MYTHALINCAPAAAWWPHGRAWYFAHDQWWRSRAPYRALRGRLARYEEGARGTNLPHTLHPLPGAYVAGRNISRTLFILRINTWHLVRRWNVRVNSASLSFRRRRISFCRTRRQRASDAPTTHAPALRATPPPCLRRIVTHTEGGRMGMLKAKQWQGAAWRAAAPYFAPQHYAQNALHRAT